MPPNFPRPPRLSNLLPKGANPLKDVIDDARKVIQTGREEVGNIASTLRPSGAANTKVNTVNSESPAIDRATDTDTLKYQLDHLLDDLQHLETEHLPQKGRLNGKPCDCISKASRDVRRHGLETIPIAARQGKNPKIFSEIAEWAEELMNIGTAAAVASGKYDDEYLIQAGMASKFRKDVGALLGECQGCPGAAKLIIERRKKEGWGKPPISLEDAKTIAARIASEEVERKWRSTGKT